MTIFQKNLAGPYLVGPNLIGPSLVDPNNGCDSLQRSSQGRQGIQILRSVMQALFMHVYVCLYIK